MVKHTFLDSLIFNIDSQLDGFINKISIFNKSFKNIVKDVKSGQGIFNSLFSNLIFENGISPKDIDCITNFMQQIKNGIPTGQAWKQTMTDATVAGKQMAVQVKNGKVNLDNLTASANTSKVAMMGFKVATVAANMALTMGLSYGLQKIIEGLDYMVHIAEKVSEAANEAFEQAKAESDKSKEKVESLEELIKKYEKLAELGINDTDSRQEAKDIQDEIVDLVGEQAKNLDLVNGKLDKDIVWF